MNPDDSSPSFSERFRKHKSIILVSFAAGFLFIALLVGVGLWQLGTTGETTSTSPSGKEWVHPV